MAEKKYTEEEIKKIINKATKMQNEDFKSDLESSRGFTLSELERIGAEVGLKREYLYAAASEFDHEDVKRFSDMNATHIFEEREIDVEMTSEAWDDICSELHHYFGTKYGKIDEDPKRLEWTHLSIAGVETVLNVSTGKNSTRVRISQRVGLASSYTESVLFGFSIAAVGAIIAAAGFDLTTTAFFATFFTLLILSTLVVFALDVAWRKKKHKDLHKLARKIERVVYRNQQQDKKAKLKLETDIAERSSSHSFSNMLTEDSKENDEESSNIKGNRSKNR